MLANAGVQSHKTHAQALARALSQNNYNRAEIDMMFQKALEDLRQHTQQIREETEKREMESRKEIAQMKEQSAEIRLELTRSINRTLYITIASLGSLIVISNAASTFVHLFVR